MRTNCLLIVFFLLFGISCKENCTTAGIEVSEILLTSAKEKYNFDYCELLSNAIIGHEIAIRKISLLEFGDSVGYDHGIVLVDLVNIVGEEKYVDSLQGITSKEKSMIEAYLDVGLEYGNENKYGLWQIEDLFPILSNFLIDR